LIQMIANITINKIHLLNILIVLFNFLILQAVDLEYWGKFVFI
jgi:hypothetical protein